MANELRRLLGRHPRCLHFDHAGGLALLPASIPLLVQRREWEVAHDPAAIQRNGYFPIDYDEPTREMILIDGDHDVFGDGSITLMLTPRHSQGHQSLRIGRDLVLANAPHVFRNASERPARLLCLCSPAGQEEFFKEVGVPVAHRTEAPPALDEAATGAFIAKAIALAPKYRTELLLDGGGPPPPPQASQ